MAEPTSIADLRAEAEEKFAGLPFKASDGTLITLRNVLRLDDTARKNALVLIKSFREDKAEEDDDELARQGRIARDLFLILADNSEAMAGEVEDWDLALRIHVVTRWTEATQAPEAPGSAS